MNFGKGYSRVNLLSDINQKPLKIPVFQHHFQQLCKSRDKIRNAQGEDVAAVWTCINEWENIHDTKKQITVRLLDQVERAYQKS